MRKWCKDFKVGDLVIRGDLGHRDGQEFIIDRIEDSMVCSKMCQEFRVYSPSAECCTLIPLSGSSVLRVIYGTSDEDSKSEEV